MTGVPESAETWGRLVTWLTDQGWLDSTDRSGSAGLELTEAEQRLWAAYPTGGWVDVSGAAVRTIRAEVLARLLLGACDAEPGCVPAVRLRGAHITGQLDISGGAVGCELRLERCTLDEAPDFSNTKARQVRFANCTLPGFDGGGLYTDGYLSLSGSQINGQVKLVRARLTGGFRMNGTKITNTDGWGVFGGGLSVEAGTFWRNADITGGVRLTGARMGGGFFLYGATLRAPGKDAMDGGNMIVEDAMECSRGFTAIGAIRLRGARVSGTLSFDQGAIRAVNQQRALQLSHMQVDELILTWTEAVGEVSLTYSRVGVLLDGPAHWPAELRLNGLVYESLRGADEPVRLNWVNRDPRGFRPQPYEQLAAWYRSAGYDDMARRAQLAKLRARRAMLNWPGRLWNYLLDGTVGYGYRPWRAAVWFGLLLAIGTTVFSLDHPHAIKAPEELPRFNAFGYTLDLLLPISAFGQREAWEAVGWTQWLAYILIAAGWVLATALVAGVTRVLRPN